MKMIKIKCIRDDENSTRKQQLVAGKIYQIIEPKYRRDGYEIDGEYWNIDRFEIVDDDYEAVPVTLKSPDRLTNNESDSQELMDFFLSSSSGQL